MYYALQRFAYCTLIGLTLATSWLNAQVQDTVVQSETEQMVLRTRLYNYAEEYGVLMQKAVDNLRGEDVASDTWLELLGWTYRSVIYFRRSPYTINPHVALADNLVFITRINHYLNTDKAKNDFGNAHTEVQRAMKEASVLIWKLAAQEMDPDALEAVYGEVEDWSKDNPINSYLSYQYPVALAADDKLITNLEQAAPDFFLGNLQSTADNAISEVKILQLQVARLSDFIEQSPIYGSWLAEAVIVGRMQESSISDAVDTVASLQPTITELNSLLLSANKVIGELENPEAIIETTTQNMVDQVGVMLIRVILVFFACLLIYRLLTYRMSKPKQG